MLPTRSTEPTGQRLESCGSSKYFHSKINFISTLLYRYDLYYKNSIPWKIFTATSRRWYVDIYRPISWNDLLGNGSQETDCTSYFKQIATNPSQSMMDSFFHRNMIVSVAEIGRIRCGRYWSQHLTLYRLTWDSTKIELENQEGKKKKMKKGQVINWAGDDCGGIQPREFLWREEIEEEKKKKRRRRRRRRWSHVHCPLKSQVPSPENSTSPSSDW